MKIIAVGASGTVGSAVAAALEAAGHGVVRASRRGPVQVDLEDTSSIEALFRAVPQVDAVVCCAARGILPPAKAPTPGLAPRRTCGGAAQPQPACHRRDKTPPASETCRSPMRFAIRGMALPHDWQPCHEAGHLATGEATHPWPGTSPDVRRRAGAEAEAGAGAGAGAT
ncbi:NAD-dependent epimerase/dehydratase family protein [Amycolatopsis sp. NPDC051372]|uniref:NAD-dependent epimerase/dehydratase family protein n=1 Tax=Amycolatopsis sp. NPDC051372 TaxID=3155669 RepID=UPI003418E875